nr:hypothetical protein Iba_chr01aCG16380 [Ipomoea batatas]
MTDTYIYSLLSICAFVCNQQSSSSTQWNYPKVCFRCWETYTYIGIPCN